MFSPRVSLSAKMNIQIPCFLCAVKTVTSGDICSWQLQVRVNVVVEWLSLLHNNPPSFPLVLHLVNVLNMSCPVFIFIPSTYALLSFNNIGGLLTLRSSTSRSPLWHRNSSVSEAGDPDPKLTLASKVFTALSDKKSGRTPVALACTGGISNSGSGESDSIPGGSIWGIGTKLESRSIPGKLACALDPTPPGGSRSKPGKLPGKAPLECITLSTAGFTKLLSKLLGELLSDRNPAPVAGLWLLSKAKSGNGTSGFLWRRKPWSLVKWSWTKSGKSLARSNVDIFPDVLGLAPPVFRNFLKENGFSSFLSSLTCPPI